VTRFVAPKRPAQVEVGSVNVPGYKARLNAEKYEAMRKALLQVVPRKPPGVTQREMFDGVRALASPILFPASTHMWWAKSVQLDLEKKGVLARDARSKPLRWTRTR